MSNSFMAIIIKRSTLILPLVILIFTFSSFSVTNIEKAVPTGIFSCTINDKPFIINNIHAEMRVVTGGYKQLSLSNDLFTSFFFINPVVKEIKLNQGQKREAIVRYTNPSNYNLYLPENGTVRIDILDENSKILTGEFEMDLIPKEKAGKKIKITNGKLVNIPIVYK